MAWSKMWENNLVVTCCSVFMNCEWRATWKIQLAQCKLTIYHRMKLLLLPFSLFVNSCIGVHFNASNMSAFLSVVSDVTHDGHVMVNLLSWVNACTLPAAVPLHILLVKVSYSVLLRYHASEHPNNHTLMVSNYHAFGKWVPNTDTP